MNDKIEIFIDMMPISANRLWLQNYRTKHTYLNPKYKTFRQLTQFRLAGKRLPKDWPYAYVEIIVHPKRRIGDADNYNKCCLDSLTYAGFWKDDKVVSGVYSHFGKPDKNGCVLLVLERREAKFDDE